MKLNEKKVSIIVNCYNGAEYLKSCLESIKKQSYKNYELIFWDNKSQDNSKEIFLNFINDTRFKYFESETHTTLYEARNLAIDKTSGDYIAFLDTDDWWVEDYLFDRIKIFNENEDYIFSFSNCYHYFQRKKKRKVFTKTIIPSGNIFDFLSKKYLVKISCLMIKKLVFLNEKKFNKNFNIIGDFEFVMRLAAKYKGFSINKPQAYIRFHSQNFLSNNRGMFYDEYKSWYEAVKNLEPYIIYKNYYENYLLYLKIVKNILKNKNKELLFDILRYPLSLNKFKLLFLFLLPKKIISYLNEKYY